MSYIIDFNIVDDLSQNKQQGLAGLESLYESMIGIMIEQNKDSGILVYTKDEDTQDNLLDVMFVYMQKGSDISKDALLQISLPPKFEILANVSLEYDILQNCLISDYDNYGHPVFCAINQNDLVFYTHKGVKFAKYENFFTYPDIEKLPFIENDAEVVIVSKVENKTNNDTAPDALMVQKINDGCLDAVTIEGVGEVLRIFDGSNADNPKIKYYNPNGYFVTEIKAKTLLGDELKNRISAEIKADGSVIVDEILNKQIEITPERLSCAIGEELQPYMPYVFLNDESELCVFTHTGVKIAAFDVSFEKIWLKAYGKKINEEGKSFSTVREVKFLSDVDGKYLSCETEKQVCEFYRLKDDENQYFNDKNDQPLYVILDNYENIKFVSKIGVLVAEQSIQIPILSEEILKGITVGGDYFKLPNIDITSFSEDQFLFSEPAAPAVSVDYLTDNEFFDHAFEKAFLVRQLAEHRPDLSDESKNRLISQGVLRKLTSEQLFLNMIEENIKNQRMHDQIQVLQENINVKNSEISDISQQLEQKKIEIADLQFQIDIKNHTINDLEASVVVKNNEIENLKNIISHKHNEIHDLSLLITQKTTEIENFSNELEEKNSTIVNLQDDLTNKNQEIQTLKDDLQQKSLDLENLTSQIDEKSTEISSLKQQIDQHEQDISNFEKQIIQNNQEISELREQGEKNSADLIAKENENTTLRDNLVIKNKEIADINIQIEQKNLQIVDLQNSVEQLNTETQTYQEQINQKNEQITLIQNDLSQKTSEILQLSTEIEQKTEQINLLGANLNQQNEQIKTLSADLTQKESQLQSLTDLTNLKIDEIESLQSQIVTKDAQLQILVNDLNEAQEQILALQIEIEQLKEPESQADTSGGEITVEEDENDLVVTEINYFEGVGLNFECLPLPPSTTDLDFEFNSGQLYMVRDGLEIQHNGYHYVMKELYDGEGNFIVRLYDDGRYDQANKFIGNPCAEMPGGSEFDWS